MLGMNPFEVLDRGHDDYLISIALMQKALTLSSEQKIEEIKILAQLTGFEVAKVIAKIF
jgi:hypothetical protein